MASGRTVELRVAGQSCRVVTTADDAELGRLTAMVEQKLGAVVAPGRPLTTQAMLLAAIALAHDAEAERTRAETIRTRARECIDGLLGRIDVVLGGADDGATRRGGDGELAARGAALTALAGGGTAPTVAARALAVARNAFARGDGDGGGAATVGVPRRQPGAAHERPSSVPVARGPRGDLDSTRE